MKILEMKTTKKKSDDPHSRKFFRKCEKFAKDGEIYKERKDLERIAKERRNLSSFDKKTSPHRAAIFFFAFHGSYYPSERE